MGCMQPQQQALYARVTWVWQTEVHAQGSGLEKGSAELRQGGENRGTRRPERRQQRISLGVPLMSPKIQFFPFLGSHSTVHRSLILCLRCMIISSTSAENRRQRWYFIHSLRICQRTVLFLGVGDKSTRQIKTLPDVFPGGVLIQFRPNDEHTQKVPSC